MTTKFFEMHHPSFGVLKVQKLSNNAALPKRSTNGAVGYDLCASQNCTILASGKGLVQTGLAISFSTGLYARLLLGEDLPSRGLLMLGQVLSIQIIVEKLV